MTVSKPETVEVTAAALREVVLNLPFANTAPIEWDDADWHSVRRALARLNATPSRQDGLREALPISVVALQNCIGAIIAAVKPLVKFHETGGHEGDGSDAQLARIREVLRTPIGKLPPLSDTPPPDKAAGQ